MAAERDGVVIVTWANFKYLDFVQNWLMHVKKIGVATYMIGAMDPELLKVPLLSFPAKMSQLIHLFAHFLAAESICVQKPLVSLKVGH